MAPHPQQAERFGKYTLVSKLAEGGMAEVHLAIENADDPGRRFVIVKRIRKQFEGDPDYVDYFLTEARVALKVGHPNMPQAYELGCARGTYYLTMEFIRGVTLLDVLRRAHEQRDHLSVATAVQISAAIAAALEHCHDLRDVDGSHLRIVHRDVTPQNILLGWDGAIKLIDFGIAQAAVQAHHTAAGVVKGKFSYLAPEMLLRDRSAVDQRADLFSLGVAMHETLTGRALFRGASDRETIRNVQSAPIPDPCALRGDIPRELGQVVLRALARDPDDRYPTALALLTDLERVSVEHGLHASVLRLRQELRRVCGDPPDHAIRDLPDAPLDHTPDGVDSDNELQQFLDLAGVRPLSSRARRLRTTHADNELAELLANLER